ncbi:MAG: InlB B-repeat-containing protein, partial [Sphaerochaetaceae bacterium]
DSRGGSAVNAIEALKGTRIVEPPSPVKNGYEFSGWFKDTGLTSVWNFNSDTLSSDITLYAKWNATAYLVTYNGNGNDKGTVPLTQEKTHGINLELAVNSGDLQRTGYSFTGWNTEGDGTGIDYAEGGIYTSDGALILYAKWTASSYSVTYDANGATDGTVPDVQSKNHGSNLVLASNNNGLAKEGYSFSGWNTQADGFGIDHAPDEEYETDAELTLYAKWIAEEYTVLLDKLKGEGGSDSIIATYDSPMTFAVAPTRDGFFFEGYYDQIDGGIQYYSSTMESEKVWDKSENSILYARWIPGYTVSFNSQSGSSVTSLEGLRPDSRINEPTAPTRSGYVFDGWFKESSCITEWHFDSDSITSNTTLYAKWISLHSVMFDTLGGSSIPPIEGVMYGMTIGELASPTKEGYIFDGWYSDNAYGDEWDLPTQTVTNDLTLYAKWLVAHTVTFASQEGNAVSSLINVLHGEKIDEPATPPVKAGYTFVGWYKTATYDEAWDFDNDIVDSDVTLYAKWAIANYSVVFDSRDGSPVSSIGNLLYGAKISEPVSPTKDKHVFDGWYKDTSYTQRYYFTTDIITSSMTLYAKWIPPSTVTFDSQGGIEVPPITDVIYGDTIKEPSKTYRYGYTFGGWYKDSACTDGYNFDVDVVVASMTLFAKWYPHSTVTFDSQGGSSVSSITRVYYDHRISEPAIPVRNGYAFDGWYREINYQSLWDFSSNKVTTSMTLFAKWVPLHLVSFDSRGGSGIPAIEVGSGRKLSEPTPPVRSGYSFYGWYKDSSYTLQYVFTADVVTTSMTLYAKWVPFGIGVIGPSGGLIFYEKDSYSDGWRYLEAAPAGWSGGSEDPEYRFGFHRISTEGTNIKVGTETGLGSGKANTQALVAAMGSSAYSDSSGSTTTAQYAAKVCADYQGGGHDDWFLPSKDELNLMYQNLYRKSLGGFNNWSTYWSSSEDSANYAWSLGHWGQGSSSRSNVNEVRPVRAF